MTTSNGLLLIDKPRGLTSHDVVARVRRILHEKRVGHAGTLDPMATGLLILGVGPSTRLLRFAQSEVKRYVGAVRLGTATDSLDADGVVITHAAVPTLSALEMNAAARSMLGAQLQTPPMVSAIKSDGRRLHELARQGIEVERTPREISVGEFTLEATDDSGVWTFNVVCSVGTYVRVLLSDLATRVGTVGHLVALRRVSSGSHHVDEAHTLEALADASERGDEMLRPPSSFVAALEHVVLSPLHERQIRMGQRISLTDELSGVEIAAMNGGGDLLAILRRRAEQWQPELVLPSMNNSGRG